jgi:hypothetical protein
MKRACQPAWLKLALVSAQGIPMGGKREASLQFVVRT